MFKKAFYNELSAVTPSEETKERVRLKMSEQNNKNNMSSPTAQIPTPEYKPPKKQPSTKILLSVAAMLVVVSMVAVTLLGLNLFDGFTSTITLDNETFFSMPANGMPRKASSNSIFNYFNSFYKSNGIVNLFGATRDETTGTLEDGSVDYEDAVENETIEESVTTPNNGNQTEDYNKTNTQVEGVDEADIVKTDGKYIYSLQVGKNIIQIVKVDKGNLSNVGSISLDINYQLQDMYLNSQRLIVIYTKYDKSNYYVTSTAADIYDVSTPNTPKLINTVRQSGYHLSSRITDGVLYLLSNEYYYSKPKKSDPYTYLPAICANGRNPAPIEDIYIISGITERSYLVISSVDIKTGDHIDSKAVLGGGETVYANSKRLFIAAYCALHYNFSYNSDEEWIDNFSKTTRIISFDINKGVITPKAEGFVKGELLNQFSLDEQDDYLRVVTTLLGNYDEDSSAFAYRTNALVVLDQNLKVVGKAVDLAPNEKVYSVRFMGKVCYFVTFRQTDPLFAVDLSNPKAPKVLSQLKIPGFSNYLHPFGDGLLFGIGSDADTDTGAVKNLKLSMFDISSPENLSEKHTLVTGWTDSGVGTDHKAIMVSTTKNLIGFSASGLYHLYSYDPEKGFLLQAELMVPSPDEYTIINQYVRGIYIGDYFYVCSQRNITSYTLGDFVQLNTLNY